MLEIDVLALPIGLGLGPALFLRLGQDALGVEPGAGDHVLGRYPVTLPATSNGETGKEIAEAQTEDDPKDRQPDDGDGFHGRSPFPVWRMNVPSPLPDIWPISGRWPGTRREAD